MPRPALAAGPRTGHASERNRWSRSGTKGSPNWEGLGGADPTAGAGDSGGVGSAAAGWTWEAGSGRLKESLVCSGSSDEGDCSAPVGAGLS